MLEKVKNQLQIVGSWKGRTMLLSLKFPLFNLVSVSVQAADHQTDSAAFETKIFAISSIEDQ